MLRLVYIIYALVSRLFCYHKIVKQAYLQHIILFHQYITLFPQHIIFFPQYIILASVVRLSVRLSLT